MIIQRLKKRSDFLRIAKSGKKYVCPAFILQMDSTPLLFLSNEEVRFGVTASKKVGNAVKRNRAKRRIRALILGSKENLRQNHDYVLIARHAIFDREFAKMQADLQEALIRIHESK